MKFAICGAGIAGATLAFWLSRAGFAPLLIEQAECLRTGGYLMDFWGGGYDVTERMEILPAVLEAGYQVQDVRFVDDVDRRVGGFNVDSLRDLTRGRMTRLKRAILRRRSSGRLTEASKRFSATRSRPSKRARTARASCWTAGAAATSI
jgi:2-polyprenyl-6-methoxyphenol hydroxylase-like FAD-dependent oxidoreductase